MRLKYLGEGKHSDKKNTTVYFLDTDLEKTYDEHLKNPRTRKLLRRQGFTRDNVTYHINEHGFRSDPFDDQPGFMFLGCSFTVAVGVDQTSMWSRLISDKYGMRMFNMGESGSSGDAAFRLANYWLPRLDVRGIFYLEPNCNRREFVGKDGRYWNIERIVPNGAKGWEDWLHYASTTEVNKDNALKNKMALKCLCDTKNIPLYVMDWQHIGRGDVEPARDLSHPGVGWNIETAQKFESMHENGQFWTV